MSRYILVDYTEQEPSSFVSGGIEMYDEGYEHPLQACISSNSVENAIGRNLPKTPGKDLKSSGLLDCKEGHFIDMSRYALDEEGYVRHTTYEENPRANWGFDDYQLELREFRPAIEMDLIICNRNGCKLPEQYDGETHCFHHEDNRVREDIKTA